MTEQTESETVTRDQLNKEVDSRNRLIHDIVMIVDGVRAEAVKKRNMAVCDFDWATIGAAEIVSRVLTTLQNDINARIGQWAASDK